MSIANNALKSPEKIPHATNSRSPTRRSRRVLLAIGFACVAIALLFWQLSPDFFQADMTKGGGGVSPNVENPSTKADTHEIGKPPIAWKLESSQLLNDSDKRWLRESLMQWERENVEVLAYKTYNPPEGAFQTLILKIPRIAESQMENWTQALLERHPNTSPSVIVNALRGALAEQDAPDHIRVLFARVGLGETPSDSLSRAFAETDEDLVISDSGNITVNGSIKGAALGSTGMPTRYRHLLRIEDEGDH